MRVPLRLLVVLIALVVGVSGAVSVTAGGGMPDPYTGQKIDLIVNNGKTIKVTAGQDFHIVHGFTCDKALWEYSRCMGSNTNFALFILRADGIARVLATTYLEEDGETVTFRRWYRNFPGGFRGGERTFVGVWTMPKADPLVFSVKVRFVPEV